MAESMPAVSLAWDASSRSTSRASSLLPSRPANLWSIDQRGDRRQRKNECEGKVDQAKGKVKQAVGTLAGDEDLKTEGRVDEAADEAFIRRRQRVARDISK